MAFTIQNISMTIAKSLWSDDTCEYSEYKSLQFNLSQQQYADEIKLT